MDINKLSKSRRGFMGTMAAAAGLGAGTVVPSSLNAEERLRKKETVVSGGNDLNIVVIIADTFRWDYLGCNGNNRVKTPNLDALATDGVYFENCYADGLPTIPARRVMHTGMSILPEKRKWIPLRKGESAFPVDGRESNEQDVTFAGIIGNAGYSTGFIVDTFHHFKPDMNFHYDFDAFRWIRGQEVDRYKSGPRNSVNPENHSPAHFLNEKWRDNMIQYLLNTQGRQGEDDYFSAQTCNTAADWIAENMGNDGPFMTFIDMFSPHEPWDAPPRFQKMYRKQYPFERYLFGYGVDVDSVRDDDIPVLIDLYSAEVSFVDHCIGKLINRIKKLGQWDNTIIVFSTDHGTHLGEQGCIQKQAKLLNSCIARVPLIIRHPAMQSSRGKRISGLTSHSDFLPTFLRMLNIETDIDFDGKNMWDLVTGVKRSLRPEVVTGYGNFGSVHNHQWHYFRNVWGNDPGLGPQLYDLKNDPNEENNVVEKHPEIVPVMKQILEKHFKVSLV